MPQPDAHDRRPTTPQRPVRFLVSALLLNLPFVLCHPAGPLVTASLPRSFVVNLVLFVVPGMAVVASVLGRRQWHPWHGLWVVGASLGTLVAAVAAAAALGRPADPSLSWTITWLLTDVAFAVAWRRGWRRLNGSVSRGRALALSGFVLAYLVYFWGATTVVPRTDDHDNDLQGTAHALLTEFRPAYPTARSRFYLAHPPLLHLYVAGSFLYHGQLDSIAVYNPNSTSAISPDEHWRYYLDHPFFAETRGPNVFMSAATVALLAAWISGITGRPFFALLLTLAYATLPETFVRSSYGGYFAGSKFFALQMLLAISAWSTRTTPASRGWLAGGLAAWANHKLVLLPIGTALWCVLTAPFSRGVRAVLRHVWHPVIVGFLAGTAGYWLYGWWVSPVDFWNDHLRHHIVDRVTNTNAIGLDMSEYPTLAGVWLEFLRDTSFLFIPLGLLSFTLLSVRRSPTADDARSAWMSDVGIWALWAAVAAVAFSVIDWKQTKHLTTLLLPMTLAPAVAVARGVLPRPVAAIVLAIVIALNVWTIAALAGDFESLVKVPEW
jgi:hypothetical protein